MSGKVSVIIPVYNGEKTIEKCINSIINQSYKDLEIIIVNDGSTDNTYEICQKYSQKDDRIQVINQENKGVCLARNIGIKFSKGDYIQFVDSDDWLEPSIIADCINFGGGSGRDCFWLSDN